MVKVDQMLYHRKIVVGELPKMQNLPEKMQPVVWKWPQSGPFEAKKEVIFGPKWTNLGPFPHTGCIFLASFAPDGWQKWINWWITVEHM